MLCVGRLAKEKNVELLLHALALTGEQPLRLAVAGDGPLRPQLEELARELGVASRTRFLGVVAREDLPDSLCQRRRVRDAEHDRDAGAGAGRGAGRRNAA